MASATLFLRWDEVGANVKKVLMG